MSIYLLRVKVGIETKAGLGLDIQERTQKIGAGKPLFLIRALGELSASLLSPKLGKFMQKLRRGGNLESFQIVTGS